MSMASRLLVLVIVCATPRKSYGWYGLCSYMSGTCVMVRPLLVPALCAAKFPVNIAGNHADGSTSGGKAGPTRRYPRELLRCNLMIEGFVTHGKFIDKRAML